MERPAGNQRDIREIGLLDALSALASASGLRAWLGVVAIVITGGTAGFMILEGWNLGDALYMTVISATTVGFREVQPLDDVGRIWTMIVTVAGVLLIFGTVGLVTEYLVSEATSGRRFRRRMERQVASLSGHFVLCGYGRVGSTVARELVHDGERFVVIDVNTASLDQARADGHLVVEGDSTDDATLRAAGIERARGLVATIDSDVQNVYVILAARALNPKLFVVGRASTISAEQKLALAGADRVVSPYTMAGRRLAELAVRPRVVDFLDAALSHGELSFSLEELHVPTGGSMDGVTVGAMRNRGIFVLAIVAEAGRYAANPPDDRVLAAGESLIVSGSADALAAAREIDAAGARAAGHHAAAHA